MPVDRTSRMIAIIDDDEAMQDSLRDLMEAAGLVARCFGSAEEFLESDLHTRAACLIVDIHMPKMSGLELQARLKEEQCDIPIIFITAYGNARMRIQAMREGAVEFLAKPFDHQLLLETVRAALDYVSKQVIAIVCGALKGVSCGRFCNSYAPWWGPGRT
jgi:FixJ family two-component response regulator